MIKYSLHCEFQHSFEGWFSDSGSFEKQLELGLVSCPECGNSKIRRALMTPNLSDGKHRKQLAVPTGESKSEKSLLDDSESTEQRQKTSPHEGKQMSDRSKQQLSADQLMTMVRHIRSYVETNGRNVGDKFAEEALKIHYGEKKQDLIYGTCSPEEGEQLADEGVEFAELPLLPKDN